MAAELDALRAENARLLNTRIVGKHQTEHDAQRAKAETARALFAERETGR